MYTAGQAGYFNVNFATVDQTSVHAVAKID
jgi:hypothetical protein